MNILGGSALRQFGAFAFVCAIALVALPAHAARHHKSAISAGASEESAEAASTDTLKGPYQEACVIEPNSGTVVFAKNEHQPWPTASLAKMMLMEIVAEKIDDGSLKLTDQIPTSDKAAKMGGSQVYLKPGENFSLDDMMKAIVVHSANDASVAVAEYIGGSTEAFVLMMNATAEKLGMKDTHYYSVHGLPPAPGQQADVASAYDQALLARALVKHPQILQWSAITTAPFRAGTFELRNTNHLVFNYSGCDGLKTGFYYKAGFNVVATAHRGAMRLIAVALGSPRKGENFRSASEMLSVGFAQYEMKAVAKKGSAASISVAVNDGAASKVVPIWGDDAAVFMKRGDNKAAYKVNYEVPATIAAPVRAGQKIGKAEVMVDGQSPTTIALLAPSDIAEKKPGLVDRLLRKF
ncbi:MAG TPA: D-alanyl-D-alanine carboxypeptidase family protein [Candidatus Binataceae bacterium]|nr:D-alanyl-D-alanine carboxypeptidase family protein [Candidatus Binataceae bacterium]